MKKIFGLILVVFFTLSCGGGFDRDAEKDKIFAIHDEVMPEISTVMKLKKRALERVEELTETNPASEDLESFRTLVSELESARKGMMTWMNDWAKNSKPHVKGESTEEEQKAFFAAEMERVKKVKKDINNALEKAQKALK